MNFIDNMLALIYRALEISLTLVGPFTVVVYLLILGGVIAVYVRRGRPLGSFIHILAGVLFFFIVWNHPAYAWFKGRPWNGGYVYALIMIVVYIYIPLKLFTLGYEGYSWFKLRVGAKKPPTGILIDPTPPAPEKEPAPKQNEQPQHDKPAP